MSAPVQRKSTHLSTSFVDIRRLDAWRNSVGANSRPIGRINRAVARAPRRWLAQGKNLQRRKGLAKVRAARETDR